MPSNRSQGRSTEIRFLKIRQYAGLTPLTSFVPRLAIHFHALDILVLCGVMMSHDHKLAKTLRNLTSEMCDIFIYLFFNNGEYFDHIHCF